MKGLLHSKRFKKNLYKWLFMYVVVIGLLTTVITYSRYISSWYQSAETKVKNFDVTIDKLTCTDYENEAACSYNRPTAPVPFYFKVDTSKLETKALFILTFHIDNKFEIIGIDEVTKDSSQNVTYKTIYGEVGNGRYDLIDTTNYKKPTSSAAILELSRTLEAKQIDETIYRVTVKYTPSRVYDAYGNFLYYDFSDDQNFSSGNANIEKVVQVDYSATQLD